MSKTVLVTGASSGIGLEIAKFLLEKGNTVIATSRTSKKLEVLTEFATSINAQRSLQLHEMDVSSDTSVKNAFAQIPQLDGLVNNAGFAYVGAINDLTTEELKEQFETNLFGIHRVNQLALPLLKRSHGTLVNISSMGGKVTFPFYGAYNSTKFALESYSEALWFELKSSGVKLYLVEPGLIQTNFYTTSMKFPQNAPTSQSRYKDLYEKLQKTPERVAFKYRSHPQVVAEKVNYLIEKRPNTFRHPVGNFAKLVLFSRWLLPDSIFLPLMAKMRQ